MKIEWNSDFLKNSSQYYTRNINDRDFIWIDGEPIPNVKQSSDEVLGGTNVSLIMVIGETHSV